MALTFPTASSPNPKHGAGSIADRWRELQGSGSWDGLLDPLDSDLRASVIAYGELAEATYDVFDPNKRSTKAGDSMYCCAEVLAASGVSHPEYYTVTKFLYATCDFRPSSESELESESSESLVAKALFVKPEGEGEWPWTWTNWIGYVAAATDEGVVALGRRDIVVAWRGTLKGVEFLKDAQCWYASAEKVLGPSSEKFKNAKVHCGFLSVYTAAPRPETHLLQETTHISVVMTSVREQALLEVRRLLKVHMEEVTSITVTGHSLGASLATLNAIDMVANRINVPQAGTTSMQPPCPVTAILFGSPRVGNLDFKRAFASFPELRALGVINKNDIVPTLPKIPPGYVDAATATLPIDTTRSPYLRPGSMSTYHNLEVYLHGVAGDHGAGGDFKRVVDRDLGLVNKRTNALKEGYPVPAEWWDANYYQRTVEHVVGRWKLENLNHE